MAIHTSFEKVTMFGRSPDVSLQKAVLQGIQKYVSQEIKSRFMKDLLHH